MPEAVTVTEEVVAPVLQDNAPVAVVDNTELPQLFVTDSVGIAGILLIITSAVAVLSQPDMLAYI